VHGCLGCARLCSIIAVAIRLDSPKPAIFRQRRCGQFGKEFTMLRFRTRIDCAEPLARTLVNEVDGPMFKMCCSLLVLLLYGLLQAASAWGQAEDFEVSEEGIVFDHGRTGLLYQRNLYHNDENVTFTPYYPSVYIDTRDILPEGIYISKAEPDPPNFIIVYVRDDSTLEYHTATVDIRVTVGHLDRSGNVVPANRVIRHDIPIQKGITRIPINIHHYKGDYVKVHLIDVKEKYFYHPIEQFDLGR
jgi:hypothetical protein